jgi:excisionase family DNA binding protein
MSNEKFLTLPEASKSLGIPYSTVLRAANAGLIPVYRPFGNRMRVRLREVVTAIEATQGGGQSNG